MYKICVYYEIGSERIIDYFPKSNIDPQIIKSITLAWENQIYRRILKFLSEKGSVKLSVLARELGHSISTISEAVSKLESLDLIESNIIYKEKKQRIINTKVLFVTENPKFKRIFNRLISQGIWIDMKKTKVIINFLKENRERFFTAEEISVATKIPVDEVKVLLENYESFITRAFSEAFKEIPFEKVVMYRYKEK
ncbi:MAG: helix-turn-helix domain-containing protein [Candidatus Woesearchaeota archaeon]